MYRDIPYFELIKELVAVGDEYSNVSAAIPAKTLKILAREFDSIHLQIHSISKIM